MLHNTPPTPCVGMTRLIQIDNKKKKTHSNDKKIKKITSHPSEDPPQDRAQHHAFVPQASHKIISHIRRDRRWSEPLALSSSPTVSFATGRDFSSFKTDWILLQLMPLHWTYPPTHLGCVSLSLSLSIYLSVSFFPSP